MKTPITEAAAIRYLGMRLLIILGLFCGVSIGASIGWWAMIIVAALLGALIPLTFRDINRVYEPTIVVELAKESDEPM